MNEPKPPIIQNPQANAGGVFPGMSGAIPAPSPMPAPSMAMPSVMPTVVPETASAPAQSMPVAASPANGGVVDMFAAAMPQAPMETGIPVEMMNTRAETGTVDAGPQIKSDFVMPTAVTPGENMMEMMAEGQNTVSSAPAAVELPPEMAALETEEEINGGAVVGGGVPIFQNGRLLPTTPSPAKTEEVKNTPKVEETAIKTEGNKKTPTVVVVIAVIALVMVVGLGITFFLVWQKDVQQIEGLQSSVNKKEQEIVSLKNELTQANDLMLIQQELPVYVDNAANFSFLQEIPGVSVTKNDDETMVHVYYKNANEKAVLDGFAMTIENKLTNGVTLATIADRAYEEAEKNSENFDLRSEMFGDMQGYSFVSVTNGVEKIIYLLQKNAQSENYLEVTYEIGSDTTADYTAYEKVIFQVLNSLKIY